MHWLEMVTWLLIDVCYYKVFELIEGDENRMKYRKDKDK